MGTFEKEANEIIPRLLDLLSWVGILIFITSIVLGIIALGVVAISSEKKNASSLMSKGVLGGSSIYFISLLIKLIENYDFFYSPKLELPLSFLLIVLGIVLIKKNRVKE